MDNLPPTSPARLRILCTGDIHLGRYPSRIHPPEPALSVTSVWRELVDYAIARQFDAVILTGDIIDRENRFYEAFGPLAQGIQQLGQHNIEVYAVAGNHDFDSLERFYTTISLSNFHLLGRNGQWERKALLRSGSIAASIVGWSFPTQYVEQSPIKELPSALLERPDINIPTIVVLHGELEHASSRYAPFMRHEIAAYPDCTWLLGHIHKPEIERLAGGGLYLYPGSLQALHPGETGLHGPWEIEYLNGQIAHINQIALATIRYDNLLIDVNSVEHQEGFEQITIIALRQRLKELANEQPSLKRIIFRLQFVGRTAIHRNIAEYAHKLYELSLNEQAVTAQIDHFDIRTRPAYSLDNLARANDPPGILARMIVALENDQNTQTYRGFLDGLIEELRTHDNTNAFSPLNDSAAANNDDTLREMIVQQALLLLDELLFQKEQEVHR